MTNEDICSFVSARMHVTDNLEQIANEVIDTCLHKVSQLNVFDYRLGSSKARIFKLDKKYHNIYILGLGL
jgi:hypothetical protein